MSDQRFPVHRDSRGDLMVVDGADLDFPVRRVFTVTGVEGGGPRGGHTADCTELVVLITGSARVRLRRVDGAREEHLLDSSGGAVTIHPDDHVDYDLAAGSSIVVLCDAPFGRVP